MIIYSVYVNAQVPTQAINSHNREQKTQEYDDLSQRMFLVKQPVQSRLPVVVLRHK